MAERAHLENVPEDIRAREVALRSIMQDSLAVWRDATRDDQIRDWFNLYLSEVGHYMEHGCSPKGALHSLKIKTKSEIRNTVEDKMAGENVPVSIVVHVLDLVNSLWQRHHDSKDAAVLHPDGKGPAGMQGQTMAIWSDTSDASGRIVSGRMKRQSSVKACRPARPDPAPSPGASSMIHERGDGLRSTTLRKKADPARRDWVAGMPAVQEGETVTSSGLSPPGCVAKQQSGPLKSSEALKTATLAAPSAPGRNDGSISSDNAGGRCVRQSPRGGAVGLDMRHDDDSSESEDCGGEECESNIVQEMRLGLEAGSLVKCPSCNKDFSNHQPRVKNAAIQRHINYIKRHGHCPQTCNDSPQTGAGQADTATVDAPTRRGPGRPRKYPPQSEKAGPRIAGRKIVKKQWRKRYATGRFRAGDIVTYRPSGQYDTFRAKIRNDWRVECVGPGPRPDQAHGDVFTDPLAWALARPNYDEKNPAITTYWRSIYHEDKRHDERSKHRRLTLRTVKDLRIATQQLPAGCVGSSVDRDYRGCAEQTSQKALTNAPEDGDRQDENTVQGGGLLSSSKRKLDDPKSRQDDSDESSSHTPHKLRKISLEDVSGPITSSAGSGGVGQGEEEMLKEEDKGSHPTDPQDDDMPTPKAEELMRQAISSAQALHPQDQAGQVTLKVQGCKDEDERFPELTFQKKATSEPTVAGSGGVGQGEEEMLKEEDKGSHPTDPQDDDMPTPKAEELMRQAISSAQALHPQDQAGQVTLKVQGCKVEDERFPELTFQMKAKSKLKKLMAEYCTRQNLPIDQVLFFFQGREVQGSDTPQQLGMKDCEVISIKKRLRGDVPDIVRPPQMVWKAKPQLSDDDDLHDHVQLDGFSFPL